MPRSRSKNQIRGSAKWLIAGIHSNAIVAYRKFHNVLTVREHVELVAAIEHLAYVLEHWQNKL